ncbi:hypothetical protein AVP1_0219 [Aeromonas phage AVP1]|nr:hypothetical protein AVP1_0219 [Aeromonas phage AVP1]
MDYNWPDMNPIVILHLSYLEPKEEVLGVIYLRKKSVERFKSNVNELLGDKFNLVELNHEPNFDEYLQKSKPITSVESDTCFMFIPFVLDSRIWKFTAPLNCTEYKNTKNATNAKELFINVEFDTMTVLQLKEELVEHEINTLGDEMIIEDVTINAKEKLVEINLFSHTNDILGTLWCFERSKELYESKLKMYSDTRVLVSKPLPLSTYELEPDQGVFTHRCVNNPAIFIAKPFSTPPFPLEVNTVNVPTIGSVRKLLDELSGNVQLNVTPVNPEPIVDVEEDLKTIEKILAKYELKLTAEQKCKFLEELVKVLG